MPRSRRLSRSAGRFIRRHGIPSWQPFLLAMFLVTLGLLFLPRGEKPYEEARKAIGGALLAVGLVRILYDHLFVRRVIGRYFELLKAAAGVELEHIYSDRSKALQDIATEIRSASGSVKISCISGSDFFGGGPVAKALSELVDKKQNVHLRFLLLSPKSRYAFLRAWVEEKYDRPAEDQATLDEGDLVPDYSQVEFAESTMLSRMNTAHAGLVDISKRLREPDLLSVI
jgi:hypothetical protein